MSVDDILAQCEVDLSRPRPSLKAASPEMVRAVGILVVARAHVFPTERTALAWAVLIESDALAPTTAEVKAACIDIAAGDERYPIPAHILAHVDSARRSRRSKIAAARYEVEMQLRREVAEWTAGTEAEIQRRAKQLIEERFGESLPSLPTWVERRRPYDDRLPPSPDNQPPTEGVREIASRVAKLKEPKEQT